MKSNTSKLILATLGGIALGSVIGILFAPEKGKNTRRKLTGRAANNIDDYIDDIIAEGKKSWKALKADAEDTSDDLDAYLTHLVTEGKKSWEKMQKEMANKAEDMTDKADSTITKAVREGKRLWNNVSNKSEDVADTVKDKVEDGKDYLKAQLS